ncbi:Predicted arabinose efflux permease, MFS family [Micromonospora nigra]|uniref:Predicted arabinose efflux permease, MFS family n=1 Tax=Micromonospora nigra TaxID=145857 RepID=A0A1C6RCV3_9ACTN|nr:MFS transporter [Micromonospora nigra]SCL14983.1 Predicted arabinose efflux permease, MFS family [Micromonospora nigra]
MTVTTRLDRSSWRPIHTRILLALGVGWALDSFEVQIIGSVIRPLAKEFGLTDAAGAVLPWALSTTWVVWFVGLMIGASGFGWLADRVGRKRLFVATLLVYSLAAVLTAFSPNFAVFLLFRFVTAMGVGGEYSAITSAITEFVPARKRGAATAATLSFWSIGGIAAGLIGIGFLNGLIARQVTVGGVDLAGWRLCLLAGALAAGYALIARRAIPESPRWLAAQGRRVEADAIVTRITGLPDDGSDPVGVDVRRSFRSQLAELWRGWRGRLVYGMVLEFCATGAYYGLFTFFGAYVLVKGQVEVADGTVPFYYLIGNVGALVGGLSVAAVIDRAGRRYTVLVAYGTAAVSVLLLALAALTRSPGLTLVAFTLCVFAATCSWISAYTTFAELFPTELRATGVGVSVSAGRIGGMVGVVGLSYTVGGLGLVTAFALLAAFFALGALASVVWGSLRGPEGRGMSLDDLSPSLALPTARS